MLYLERTFDSPAMNLALDEALIETGEQGGLPDEVLRVWLPRSRFIVVGRGGKVRRETYFDHTVNDRVPIFRRCSGGGSVVLAPGCLLFSLILSLEMRPEVRMVDSAHQFVMRGVQRALSKLAPDIALSGTCDLVIGQRKVGGNSLRVKRSWMLYHGTILLNMGLELVDAYLQHPPREPEYRAGRPHAEFLANLHLDPELVTRELRSGWRAVQPMREVPLELAAQLYRTKYSTKEWNLQR